MSIDMIPVVDLRLLSQAELNSLSLSSSAGFDPHRSDDIIVPKIDRSVFNESAGSRKQTYSRLRLAPRKSDLSSSPAAASGGCRSRRRSGGLLPVPSTPTQAHIDDPCHRENKQIVLFLRQLFAKGGSKPLISTQTGEGSTTVRDPTSFNLNPNPNPNPSPNANYSLGSVQRKRGRKKARIDVEVAGGSDKLGFRDGEVMNMKGVAVDLVGLGEKQDLFGEELRRRTKGLVTEEEFLNFLRGLEGEWGSRRKKRRIVEAGIFGDELPRGWKILIGLKRKEGNVWLHCRQYISPNGKQFASCKEVSSYLLSLAGPQEARHPISGQGDENTSKDEKPGCVADLTHQEGGITRGKSSYSSASFISSISADSQRKDVLFTLENPVKVQVQSLLECQKCNLTFADKGSHVQHLLTFHHKSAKRCRLGKSIGDGVIIKDGKYECQFCHKMFSERHRYNGHVGVHVRNYPQSIEVLPSVNMKVTDTASVMNASISIKDEKILAEETCTAKPFSEFNPVTPCNKQHVKIRENNCSPNCSALETTHVTSSKSVGDLINDYGTSDQKLQNASEIPNAVNVEHGACDASAPSPMVVNNTTCETFIENDPSANTMMDVNETACGEWKMGFESHMTILSESGQAYAEKVLPANTKIGGSENSSNEQKLCSEYCSSISSNEQTYSLETSMNRTLTNTMNKHEVVDMDKSGNEKESGLTSGDVISEHGAIAETLNNDIRKSDNMKESDIENSVSIGQTFTEKGLLAHAMIDEIEKASNEQKIDPKRHLSSLSESGRTYVVESNTNGTFTEQANSLIRGGAVIFDGDAVAENTMGHDIDMSDNELEKDENCLLVCRQPCTEEILSARTVINDIEKFNSKQKSSEQTYFDETNGSDPLTCNMENRDLFNMYDFSNEQEGELGGCEVVSDSGVVAENDKIAIAVNQQERVLESQMHDMPHDDMKESMIGGMEKTRNELESGSRSDHAASWEDSARDLENAESGNHLQNLMVTTQSPWVQSSLCLTTLDLFCNQGEDGVSGVNANHENIAGYEDLRSRSNEHMDFAYNATDLELGFGPPIQLGWDLALPDMVNSSRLTTVCVWCGMEFSHESMSAEVPSDSVGYMCPTCKAKISGQLQVPYDGLSGK